MEIIYINMHSNAGHFEPQSESDSNGRRVPKKYEKLFFKKLKFPPLTGEIMENVYNL